MIEGMLLYPPMKATLKLNKEEGKLVLREALRSMPDQSSVRAHFRVTTLEAVPDRELKQKVGSKR